MSIHYYDREGEPITETLTWAKKFEDRAYKRVAETLLANGRWVSTVWIGLDHQMGVGPPLIFETMVFPSKDDMSDIDVERYSTEAEAIRGHTVMCDKWEHKP